MTGRACLVPFETSPRDVSPRQVGGKAWNLLRLRHHGFLVPHFRVVPREHFDRAVEGCRETVERAQQGDAFAAAARLAEEVRSRPVPAALVSELATALPPGGVFAVRSSAVGEDSERHSFAGMLDSVLNVPAEEVPNAVGRVWASAFSARALAYRARKGLAAEQAATAVIVQDMVPAATAGVLVTRDPADGARRIVIAAGIGLGQGVVDGTAETDTHRMGWDGGPCASDVRVNALDARQVQQLRSLGRDVERALGGPQDVEWAFDREGRLFVLQARPVIGAPSRGRRRVWDNANIVESYPGLTLPLTFSFASRAYRRAFSRVARSFGAPPDREDLYEGLIGLVDGRVYYNLLDWYEMFALLPGSERYRASWDRLIGVGDASAAPAVSVSAWTRARALAASVATLLRMRSLGPRFRARFDALHARFAAAGSGEATIDEALATFRALEEHAASFWHLTLQNDFCALKLHQWAGALLARWGEDGRPDGLAALLGGAEPVESVEPVRSLLALVEAVSADPAARELLERSDDPSAWAALGVEPRWQALYAAFLRHLEAYGDRTVAELKLETVTFAEDPPLLVGLIRRYLSLGVSAARLAGTPEPPERAEALRRHGVRGPRRLVLRLVLDRARAALCAREEMRLARTRLFGIVRRLFRRLGTLLAEQGHLDASSDVHYLAIGELLDFARGTGVTREIRDLVTLRKAEYARFAGTPAPARFETTGVPRMTAPPAGAPVNGGRGSLSGSGCSAGVANGRAAVVLDPACAESGRDRILVAPSTDPGWVYLMMASAGIVVERGSLLSHTAIIGRELGIPTVVGATDATRLIPDGAPLRIDGGTGDVRWA